MIIVRNRARFLMLMIPFVTGSYKRALDVANQEIRLKFFIEDTNLAMRPQSNRSVRHDVYFSLLIQCISLDVIEKENFTISVNSAISLDIRQSFFTIFLLLMFRNCRKKSKKIFNLF